MKGELEFTRLLRVDGRFEGDLITDKGSLVVGPKGEVVGDLKNMQVGGTQLLLLRACILLCRIYCTQNCASATLDPALLCRHCPADSRVDICERFYPCTDVVRVYPQDWTEDVNVFFVHLTKPYIYHNRASKDMVVLHSCIEYIRRVVEWIVPFVGVPACGTPCRVRIHSCFGVVDVFGYIYIYSEAFGLYFEERSSSMKRQEGWSGEERTRDGTRTGQFFSPTTVCTVPVYKVLFTDDLSVLIVNVFRNIVLSPS